MKRVKTLELVKGVLETHPFTRSDDFELIREVSKSFGLNIFSFENALTEWHRRNLPPFEAITRARRKVQELYPDLAATAVIKDRRTELAGEYRNTFGVQGSLQL